MSKGVFLAPMSEEHSLLESTSTIYDGVPYELVEPYLDENAKSTLSSKKTLFIWGNTPGKEGSWKKIETGDLVLFYSAGSYVLAGKVSYKMKNKELSNKLWGTEQGKSWEFIFFLEDLKNINIPASMIQDLAKYKSYVVQGFQPLNQVGIDGINKKYGSIEALVNSFIDTTPKSIKSSDKQWEKFEDYILEFLESLGFQHIRGGNETRKIFGQQIDACGGFDNFLVFVEAKSSGKKSSTSIENTINDIVVNKDLVKKNAKKDPIYSKYTDYIFVIATKNYEVGTSDQKKAEKHNIKLWDAEHLIQYYKDLSEYIGKYSTYNLFGEMGVKVPNNNIIRTPAIVTQFNGIKLYSFFIEAQKLLQFSYVRRRERGKSGYYQRIIKKDRLKSIAENFLDKGGMFPNSIIINLDKRANFIKDEGNSKFFDNPNTSFGILNFPEEYCSSVIIDGQHRLYSCSKTDRQIFLPVTAFIGLSMTEEMKFFVDINEKQKPVDSNLIWDLNGEIQPDKPKGIISNSVKMLSEMEPFKTKGYRIYIPSKGKKKQGDLNLSGICDTISKSKLYRQNLKSNENILNPLYSQNPDTSIKNISKNLSETLQILDTNFSDVQKNFFFHSDGAMSVLILFYEKVLSSLGSKTNEKKINISGYFLSLKKYLDGFEETSLRKLKESLTSEAMKDLTVNDFVQFVGTDINDDDILNLVKKSQYTDQIDNIEKPLRDFINQKLCQKDPKWIENEEIVDSKTYTMAKLHLDKKKPEDPRKHVYEFLTIGNFKNILKKPKCWELMKEFFVNSSGNIEAFKFDNEDLFFGGFSLISDYRNPPAHGTKIKLDKSNLAMIESVVSKLERIIQNYSK